MKENKFLYLPFIISLVLALLFLTAQLPSVQAKPKHLPIGLVNEANPALSEQLITNAPDAIHFITYTTVDDMKQAMNERLLYGGLVIPADFTSLQGYSNEGLNPTIAPMVENMLTGIATQLNAGISQQTLAATKVVPSEQVASITNPLPFTLHKVNEAGTLASVPGALFTAVWLTSLIGAVLFYLAGTKRVRTAKLLIVQSLLPIVYSFFTGFSIAWLSTWVLGYDFASLTKVGLMLSLAMLGFVYLILATVSWLKLPSVALFALLLFFGMPLIQLAPEMLTPFYRDFVLPWLPMRFLIEGLKEILYFGGSVINPYSIVLLCVAGISFILLWIKNTQILTQKA